MARLGLWVKVVGQKSNDLDQVGIVGRRSKVKVKCRVLTSLLPSFKVKIKGRDQGQGQICVLQLSILGARLYRVQSKDQQPSLPVYGVSLLSVMGVCRKLHGCGWSASNYPYKYLRSGNNTHCGEMGRTWPVAHASYNQGWHIC